MPTQTLPRTVSYPHRRNDAPERLSDQTADAAIDITQDGTHLLSKTSAGAYSVAAPGATNVGRRLKFMVTTDFAHVVTFTGSTLRDGTTGAKITWTTVAFAGCALEVLAVSATLWHVQSKNLGTVA